MISIAQNIQQVNRINPKEDISDDEGKLQKAFNNKNIQHN